MASGIVGKETLTPEEMMDLSSMQGLMVVVGPILLAIAIAWAILHNRSSKREVEHTEEATARMYDEQGREDATRDGA